MGEYSYATGCYQSYQRICSRLPSDQKAGACHEEGLAECEDLAKRFRTWLESNPSH